MVNCFRIGYTLDSKYNTIVVVAYDEIEAIQCLAWELGYDFDNVDKIEILEIY